MREIVLTRGLVALVDDGDFVGLSEFSWCANPAAKTHYALSRINGVRTYMHRLIMRPGPGQYVDHINHDGLDNRRANLRLCSRAQNAANVRQPSGRSRSGFRRVAFLRKCIFNPYQAVLKVDGVLHKGGYHSDPAVAAREYDELARKHFGEFATLNFPEAEISTSNSTTYVTGGDSR